MEKKLCIKGIWNKSVAFLVCCFLVLGQLQPIGAQTISQNDAALSEEIEIIPIEESDVVTAEQSDAVAAEYAGAVIDSGISNNIKWYIDTSYHLYVEGTGDYELASSESGYVRYTIPPWYDHREGIVSATVKTTGMTTTKAMFRGCRKLTSVNLAGFDSSNLTDTTEMFRDCTSLKTLDLSCLDTSNVSKMAGMFYNCWELESLNLSGLRTENVESMKTMFWECRKLKDLDLSSFYTPNLTDVSYMFSECVALESLNLANFDISNTDTFTDTLDLGDCEKLNRIVLPATIGSTIIVLPGADTTEVADKWHAYLTGGDQGAVTEGNSLYEGGVLARKDGDKTLPSPSSPSLESGVKISVIPVVFSNLTDQYNTIKTKSIILTNTGDTGATVNVELVSGDVSAFTITQGDTTVAAGERNTTWKIAPVKGLTCNENQTPKTYTATLRVTYGGGAQMASNVTVRLVVEPKKYNLTVENGGGGGSYVKGAKVKIKADAAPSGKVFIKWLVKEGCVAFEDVTSATTTIIMPEEAAIVIPVYHSTTGNPEDRIYKSGTIGNLQWSIDEDKVLWITGEGDYDPANPEWLQYKDEILSAKIQVTNITSTEKMFSGLTYLKEADLSGLDTSQVVSMKEMFRNCKELESVDVSGLDMGTVSDISYMFQGCDKLKYMDFSEVEADSIIDCRSMFYDCSMLQCLDLSGFDLTNNTTSGYMLERCSQIKSIAAPKKAGSLWISLPYESQWRQYDNGVDKGACTQITNANEGMVVARADGATTRPVIPEELRNPPEPTYPKDPSDPNEPTDPTDPVEPSPITPSKPISPVNPTQPTTPEPDDSTGTTETDNTTDYEKQLEEIAQKYDVSKDTLNITEESITNRTSDSDMKGSSFGKLKAKATKNGKNSIKLSWSKVEGADGYIVYGNRCNTTSKKYKCKRMKTLSANKTSYTAKKLKKGQYYKFIVRAYKNVNGKKVTIASSVTIHSITKGGKYGIAKSVKIEKIGKKKNTTKITLKKGKTATIKAKEIKESKPIKRHRKLVYESSNKKVATVSKSGKIKAKGKGKCKIYVYAQNGVYKTITVTVK